MRNAAHSRRYPVLALALVVGVAIVTAAVPAYASESAAELQPQTLVRAKAIRTEVNARYRRLAGRKLRVTDVTTMGVIESLRIMEDPLEPDRVVPTDNGIYFQLCSARAKCPYPARSAAWPDRAFRPRRMALELAVRTFSRTAVDLVVVALPTRFPTWIVFERDDLSAEVGAPLRGQFTADPGYAGAEQRALVDRLTWTRTVVPIEMVPVAGGRYAVTAAAVLWP